MEPRIYQLNNNATHAVSPTFSNWSPIVSNPFHIYGGQDQVDEDRFAAIRRSFAFDEWDDDEDSDDAPSYFSFSHNDSEEDQKSQPETLALIPSVEHGRTIYDATQGYVQQPPSSQRRITRPTLDTYMTVTYLDDILKTSSSTSTETSGNNNEDYKNYHFQHPFHCQSIPRHSTTYRWTSGTPPSSHQPPVMSRHDMYEGADDHSYSSESEPPCPPIPKCITVYKNE